MSWDAGLILVLVVGMLIGWFAGWIARTDENRRYAEAFRRRIEVAELEAKRAWAEVERIESLPAPAAATPTINVHLTAPALPSYQDLAGAAAAALARDRVRVIEAGVVDG